MRPGCGENNRTRFAQANSFAHIVRNENNRLVSRRPDALDIGVKLLARQRVERGKRLIHQKHARIRCERARKRDALFHAAGKFVNVCAFESGQSDQFQIISRDIATIPRFQVRLQLQSENDVAENIEPREERRFLKHDEPFATGAGDRFAIGHNRPAVRFLQAGDDD